MRLGRRSYRLAVVTMVSVGVGPGNAQRPPRFQPCELEGVAPPIDCGTIPVPEDRSQRTGRVIPLNIVVLRALASPAAPDPVYVIQGGPGQAATTLATFYAGAFAPLRQHRDIVLVDVRGTGKSNGLICSPRSPGDLREIFAVARVRVCYDSLSSFADFKQYTTAAIVADLVAVLDSLEIRSVNLYGTSYGTRVGFEAIRADPDRIRTATMKGVVTGTLIGSKDYSSDAFAVASAIYSSADQDRINHLLRQPPPGMSSGFLSEVIRNQLYAPPLARRLTDLVTKAEQGDYSALTGTPDPFAGAIALGMALSVLCAEDLHQVAPLVDSIPTVRTLGRFRDFQQAEACKAWPVPPSTAHRAPLRSSVPVLLVSGELDPVTPPRFAEQAVRLLSNGRHVILKDNGHAMGDRVGCIVAMMGTLIENRSAASISPGCEVRTPPR